MSLPLDLVTTLSPATARRVACCQRAVWQASSPAFWAALVRKDLARPQARERGKEAVAMIARWPAIGAFLATPVPGEYDFGAIPGGFLRTMSVDIDDDGDMHYYVRRVDAQLQNPSQEAIMMDRSDYIHVSPAGTLCAIFRPRQVTFVRLADFEPVGARIDTSLISSRGALASDDVLVTLHGKTLATYDVQTGRRLHCIVLNYAYMAVLASAELIVCCGAQRSPLAAVRAIAPIPALDAMELPRPCGHGVLVRT